MLIVKVKVCGITNYEDAAAAVDMGADILGFNFYPKSPRYIPAKKASDIINKLPAEYRTKALGEEVAGVFGYVGEGDEWLSREAWEFFAEPAWYRRLNRRRPQSPQPVHNFD